MITCIGNPVFDLIETLRIKSKGRVLSGCSTNACLALAKLGRDTTLVGRIGDDFIEKLHHEMEHFNVRYAVEKSKQTGGFKLIYYDDQGNRSLELLGDAKKISFFPEELVDSDWILFGPIFQEIDIDYVKMIKSKSRAKIFVDPQGFIRRNENGLIKHHKAHEIEEIASLSNVFKPNEVECRILTGIDPRIDYKSSARIIKSWGADLVILTLAEQGSVMYDGNEFYLIPAYATEALDPTGAGDTYAAGIIYAFDNGYDYYQAGCFASSVSSIMVECCGPDFPLTQAEAEKRKNELLNQ